MLRVLSAVLGPVFVKEVLEVGRRKRYFFNRLLYGAALLFVLVLVYDWYSGVFLNPASLSARDFARYAARMAATLFTGVSVVQYAAVYLFLPLFLCGALAG